MTTTSIVPLLFLRRHCLDRGRLRAVSRNRSSEGSVEDVREVAWMASEAEGRGGGMDGAGPLGLLVSGIRVRQL